MDMIRKRVTRTGDKNVLKVVDENNNVISDVKYMCDAYQSKCSKEKPLIWGWDDSDLDTQSKLNALILRKSE